MINGLPARLKKQALDLAYISAQAKFTALNYDFGSVKLGTSFNFTLPFLNIAQRQMAFTIVSGAMPSGLSLNPATGVLTGALSGAIGNYSFTIRLNDGYQTNDLTCSIIVALPDPVNNPLHLANIAASWNSTQYIYGSYSAPAPIKAFDWTDIVSGSYWVESGFDYSLDNVNWIRGFTSPQPGNGSYGATSFSGTVSGLNNQTIYFRGYAQMPDRSQSWSNSELFITQARFA